jgi:hypothetical protein
VFGCLGSSVVAGGSCNIIRDTSNSIIGGGDNNCIYESSCSSILGGRNNYIPSSYADTTIIGSNISATRVCTTHVNALIVTDIPTASAGLPSGTFWSDSGTIKIIP